MYDNTIFVIILMLCVIIYMLPTLIAYARDIPRRQAVTVVNIIFGWTLIGWFITFLWASLAATSVDEPA
jgi:T4 superinfection immunity protein